MLELMEVKIAVINIIVGFLRYYNACNCHIAFVLFDQFRMITGCSSILRNFASIAHHLYGNDFQKIRLGIIADITWQYIDISV